MIKIEIFGIFITLKTEIFGIFVTLKIEIFGMMMYYYVKIGDRKWLKECLNVKYIKRC